MAKGNGKGGTNHGGHKGRVTKLAQVDLTKTLEPLAYASHLPSGSIASRHVDH